MSDWKEESIKRRDFRHVHGEPEVPRSRAKKDTKRWCKGKIGREHKPSCVARKYFYVLECSVCGKHIDWYYTGSVWYGGRNDPVPNWVVKTGEEK
jgi:hypothetical protein